MELFERNACDLSEMIKNKEISSAELTKSVFDRIKAVEGKVDAYLTLDEENAMKKAAEIDEKLAKGEELSPLAGIPVGIKDNISTKGLRTTCASKMLGNYVPPFNATCRSEAYIRQRFKIRSCCFRFITGSDRTSRHVRKGRCYGTVCYRWS